MGINYRKDPQVVTKVKRATALNPVQTFSEHIVLKRQASTITTRANALKDTLKKWFLESPSADVYENENGSKFFDFDETVSDGKDDYKGMELRRAVSNVFDEETAEKILLRKVKKDPDIIADSQSVYFDQDKIFRLVQEGRLSEKDVEEMFTEKESFAFWPIKGEVI